MNSTAACSFGVTRVYLKEILLNQQDVGHILNRRTVKITNKEVLVSPHRGLVLDKGCILHQTHKLGLLMLRVSMAAALL